MLNIILVNTNIMIIMNHDDTNNNYNKAIIKHGNNDSDITKNNSKKIARYLDACYFLPLLNKQTNPTGREDYKNRKG